MGSLSGTLYVGFTGNLHKRAFQHKFHHFEGFTEKYKVERLLYWASFDDVHKAIAREKQLKDGLDQRRSPSLNRGTRIGWIWQKSVSVDGDRW